MKAIIIGGGLAGLSAAVYLSDYGFECTVLEQSPKFGGRAYSFHHPKFPTAIDNGQHLMLGCYRHTLEYLKRIGASDTITMAPRLKMNLFKADGTLVSLKAPKLPFPLDLAAAFLRYKALSMSQRIKMLPFMVKLNSVNPEKLSSLSVMQWLQENNQTDEMIQAIWEMIGIGALNTSLENASAQLFATVIQEIFTKDSFSSSVILPNKGLSDMYVPQSIKYIQSKGGVTITSSPVQELLIENDTVVGVVTDSTRYTDFDIVVSTVPLYALEKIKNSGQLFSVGRVPTLEYSAIMTLHLLVTKNMPEKDFYGFLSSPLHWVFNKKTHLTTVISNADVYNEWEKEALFDLVMKELEKYLGISKADVSDYLVIKEKRATFVPSEINLQQRPQYRTVLKNTYLAGDYTNTGLPATIEGAVKSGRTVADAINSEIPR